MADFDESMMALALAEAEKGWGNTSPNPMVGAVVVKEGRVISTGYHAEAGRPHAEVEALSAAGDRAFGAALYVTLEPCRHHGRTPPCTQAILSAGISRVVIGALDPNRKVIGGGAAYLREEGLEVKTGVLEGRCRELNLFFNHYAETGRPFVLLKTAATMDGKVATKTGHSKWITGPAAREYVHYWRQGVDAILVGRRTVELDDPSLNARPPGVDSPRDPWRVVLDARLRLGPEYRVFDPRVGGESIVVCGPEADKRREAALRERGVAVWRVPLVDGRVSLAAVIERLGQSERIGLMIEGGGRVNYSALLVERVVDRLFFFYAPKIVGGAAAPTLTDGAGVDRMDEGLDLEIIDVGRYGPDLLVAARPVYAS